MTESRLDAPLLLGRYQPLVLLARGGSSLVYRGRDETLGRDIAIKVLTAGGDSDLGRYNDELRLLASLSHHGVVSIVDAGIDESAPEDPRPFLVMELVRGQTLRDTALEGTLTHKRVGEVGYEVAEALDYVHSQGVIHRDITPANIMITDYGTVSSRPRARLTDFGIAIESGARPGTGPRITGTAAYLSPEQVRNQVLTPATDIYSLGLVMLEGFTGTVAFPGKPVDSALARLSADPVIPDDVSKPWRAIIRRMTRPDPIDRPDAAEVVDDIRRTLRKLR